MQHIQFTIQEKYEEKVLTGKEDFIQNCVNKILEKGADGVQFLAESQPNTETKMFGTTKWFNQDKGYGFITPDEGGKDIFVHASQVQKSRLITLKEGQRVEFDVEQAKKGQEAVNIRLVGETV